MAFVKSEWMKRITKPNQTYAELEKVLPSLRRYCLSLTGSQWDADDLLQSTCLKLLGRASGQNQELPPTLCWEAYMIRTARNLWVDQNRQQAASQRTAERLPSEKQHVDRYNMELELAMAAVIEWLSPWQRAVYIMRDILSYSTKEAAEWLDCSEGAVKAALARARSALAECRRTGRQVRLRLPDGQYEQELLQSYLAAFRSGSARRLVDLVMQDALHVEAAAPQILHQSMQTGSIQMNTQMNMQMSMQVSIPCSGGLQAVWAA
ncbi:RNA polymerase sigma factor [Paenibacillus sambharensis]|uniref:RNA polymerase sigma factor n=1 Tax=Paenibacillus sambharensis TaxID=1803190 RepID=A0A2W1LF82_9BACL|nr:sigma-70 family RNA polymerase sigma factor [Paenibacillus sambharensis]PZD97349.1 RNA polymerase sigma factor [Paenibacillus sambharensis]